MPHARRAIVIDDAAALMIWAKSVVARRSFLSSSPLPTLQRAAPINKAVDGGCRKCCQFVSNSLRKVDAYWNFRPPDLNVDWQLFCNAPSTPTTNTSTVRLGGEGGMGPQHHKTQATTHADQLATFMTSTVLLRVS